jgi:UDP-2-acetamido-2,6-beta-L-arabino-hexul-4-ose reductase
VDVKIVVTGANGLLGWHSAARLHAENCAAAYRGEALPYQLELVGRDGFRDPPLLVDAVRGADAILHFAGVNRGSDVEIAEQNPAIARTLVAACGDAGSQPHIVYANSTHSRGTSTYGVSKRVSGEILSDCGGGYTDLVLPHIFGECARPRYNNVTATLIDALWRGERPEINPEGRVQLLHAGAAADLAIGAAIDGQTGVLNPEGRTMTIVELFDRLQRFHSMYGDGLFPNLDDPFDLALFNSYRTGGYPDHYPKAMRPNRDARGMLFESSRALGAAQTFVSTTLPGKRRGDHFHTNLVERFLVVSGSAVIRIRKVLTDEVHSFRVSGNEPVAIDMPPLHTHHIENDSDEVVVTHFWSHRLFDRANPDTFADPVIQ